MSPYSNTINIVCATDDNYVSYCGVMLTSVFENHKSSEVNVYVMIDKPLSCSNMDTLNKLSEFYRQNIRFIQVDNKFLEAFPIKGDGVDYWSIVTYYRLYAAELLPSDVDRVLYLDCDTIVNGPLNALFDLSMADYAVGAVSDMCTEWDEYYTRLGYDKSKGYFNAGVLLMNLSYWREHNVGQECLDYLRGNYERIKNNDQDVLNAVLVDSIMSLPVTYNYQIQFRRAYFFDGFKEELKQDILSTDSPAIIHYAAELKPWMLRYYPYPFNDVWHKYKKKSPWHSMPQMYPKKRRINYFIKRYFLWPFGIMTKLPEMR